LNNNGGSFTSIYPTKSPIQKHPSKTTINTASTLSHNLAATIFKAKQTKPYQSKPTPGSNNSKTILNNLQSNTKTNQHSSQHQLGKKKPQKPTIRPKESSSNGLGMLVVDC
jgi:hypothetical protein